MKWKQIDVPVLGLAGRHFGNGNWKIAGTFARHHGWSSLARAIHVPTGPLQINQHSIRSFTSVQMLHTLDKNGSLYDPAGTES